MYWEYLGFTEPPFALTPNPDFLFLSSYHQEAFAHLLYAIDTRAGFIELSGEVGTGKTTIIRTLLHQLDPETYRTALIFNPSLSPLGLLQEINREFGLAFDMNADARSLHQALNDFLLKESRSDHTVVLVIDEAQNLSSEVLEQIRLISNLETEREKLIQIVLVGQPELEKLLNLRELRQLNQRITVRYRLQPMEFTDVHEYIRHRIRVAADGREPVTFSPASIKRIYRFSKGFPRVINAICDRALLLAYTNENKEISPSMASAAINDVIKKIPLQGNRVLKPAIAAIALLFFSITVFTFMTYFGKKTEASKQDVAVLTDNQYGRAGGIRVLQELLKSVGHYKGVPDGIFDNKTELAVRSFQQAEGLTVDGKPGGKTLSRLYQLNGGLFPTNERNDLETSGEKVNIVNKQPAKMGVGKSK